MRYLVRIELTNNSSLVWLAKHYTVQGAQDKPPPEKQFTAAKVNLMSDSYAVQMQETRCIQTSITFNTI